MHEEIIMSGIGGQGVMVIGQLLAHAAVRENKNVVWFPSYGPETRGGLADCTVIIADDEIGSPVSSFPDVLIALHQLLLDKFAPIVRPNGTILVNTSLAQYPRNRSDCRVIEVPANDIATAIGNPRGVNMVMLGAYVALGGTVRLESVKSSLPEVLPKRHHGLIPLNEAAMDKGAELVQNPSMVGV